MENLDKLVRELLFLPHETEWVEFKHDNYDPQMIGRDISALANGAALMDKDTAYFIWGIDDETHEIVGTNYDLHNLKKGNQELENWLRYLLSAHADFEYKTVIMEGKTVGVIVIRSAMNLPVTFEKQEYIRVGSYTKLLREYPAIQSRLWNKLQNQKFEEQIAKKDLSTEAVLDLLHYEVYFKLLTMPLPHQSNEVLNYLETDEIVIKQDNGLYSITNLGAILLAKKITDFPRVARKVLRIIQYEGKNKLYRLRENPPETGGYAVVFEDIMRYIHALVPAKETIENGLRKKQAVYAIEAIREIVANALIHQDFSITGAGPMVEIFSNRIEITNPGRPLIDVFRIVDTPPRSRNEKLSALMRRMRICEESGTGWDKSVIACEIMQLPAPRMDVYEESTKVTLLSEMKFSDLSTKDRLWGCYLHACIRYIQGDYLTNRSLRERFGLKTTSSGMVSRIIKEAIAQNLIRPFDQETAPRYMKYIPIWG